MSVSRKGLSVEEARARMLALAGGPIPEVVELTEAAGRVLLEPVRAVRDQPPFDASAMDGWAVRAADAAGAAGLQIVGESAAGAGFDRALGVGEAVRIFTGAPVPQGADLVVIQEEAVRDGDQVRLGPAGPAGANVRPRGGDFYAGDVLLEAGVRLDPWRLSLAASAGQAMVTVARRPRVAVLATGAELVVPGGEPRPDQIFESGGIAVVQMFRDWGADAFRLATAGDDLAAIAAACAAAEADLIVTIGGASVGDHDLVKPALASLGLDLAVETINVRPGKPTWFGRLADGRRVLGLPGNPASAFVCAELFGRPVIDTMLGAPAGPALISARLGVDMPSNGPREHWLRARTKVVDGVLVVTPFSDQDSSLITVFAAADALLRRLPGASPAAVGVSVEIVALRRV